MHKTNTKQIDVREMSPSDGAEASSPPVRRDELKALRTRLVLKKLLRARRIMTLAKRTLTVTVIGAMVWAAGSARPLPGQQADAGESVQPAQQTPAGRTPCREANARIGVTKAAFFPALTLRPLDSKALRS